MYWKNSYFEVNAKYEYLALNLGHMEGIRLPWAITKRIIRHIDIALVPDT